MNIFRKIFEPTKEEKSDEPIDYNRNSNWFDDTEGDIDREICSFNMFANPSQMQKQFEQQILDMLKTLDQFDARDSTTGENYKKQSFDILLEQALEGYKGALQNGLDEEITPEQFRSILQPITLDKQRQIAIEKIPILANIKIKRTDDEIIWERIHGTYIKEPDAEYKSKSKSPLKAKIYLPNIGGLEGPFQERKIISRSIISKTVRKPDGSCETSRTVRDADGTTNTTITRTTSDGKSETFNYNNDNMQKTIIDGCGDASNNEIQINRNIYLSKDGYALPRNIC